jgi:hypothetical protein
MSISTFLSQIAALVLLASGWLLNELSRSFQSRRDEKAGIGRTLLELLGIGRTRLELLEIHFQLRLRHSLQPTLREVFKELGVAPPPPHVEAAAWASIHEILPSQESLVWRYETTVSQVGSSDPFLAFDLRSRDFPLSVMPRLRDRFKDDAQAALLLPALESQIAVLALPALERLIREVSSRHSRGMRKRAELHLGKPFPNPETKPGLRKLLTDVAVAAQGGAPPA